MRKKLTRAQRALFALAAVSVAAAAVFGFCMIGFLMSALVCLGIAACLIFFGVLAPYKTALARRLRVAMVLLLIVGFGLFMAAEIPVLSHIRGDEDTDAPYLLVCGAGVNGGVPSRSLVDRMERALTWLEDVPEGVAVLSGSQGPGEHISEARAMFDWLTDRGVDPARLLLDEQADSSYENIKNALDIIAGAGGDPAGRLAILSSEYHLCRLSWMAERLGCQPVLVAAPTSRVSLFVNYAIREACAMWHLWLFGM